LAICQCFNPIPTPQACECEKAEAWVYSKYYEEGDFVNVNNNLWRARYANLYVPVSDPSLTWQDYGNCNEEEEGGI